MTKPEPKNPFYWLREVAQDALLLALPTLMLRVLATTLARRADEDYFARTGELISWIGADNLAKAMKCNRRTVQRGLIWLLEHGVITKWEKGGGRKRSTRYCFSKQWLGMAALELENSGQAKAYGLPDDLFSFADGNSLTAVSRQFCGQGTAESTGAVLAAGQNSGLRTANLGGNSGLGSRVSQNSGRLTAESSENSGQFSAARPETAVGEAENCGLVDKNCGPAMPPEIGLNIRNKTAPSRKTATAREHDPRQLHWNHAIPGGKAPGSESSGFAGADVDGRQLARLIPRAAEILGDENRAALAVSWLGDDQKRQFLEGYRPNDETLGRWLGWALERADEAGESAAPPVEKLPVDLTHAVQQAAQQAARNALKELLPSLMPTLARELLQHLRPGGDESAAA